MSIKVLASNAIWSMLTHLMGRGSLVVVTMILSNKMITSDFATYSYFQLTISMLAAYGALGMGITASKFFAEVGVVSDEMLPPLGALWFLSILIGSSISLIVLFIPDDLITGGVNLPRWLLALGVFVAVTSVIPSGAVLGLEQYKKSAFFSFLTAVTLIFGVFNLPKENPALVAMVLFVIAQAIQSLGNTVVVLKKVSFHRIYRTFSLSKSSLACIASFSGPMLFVSIMAASGSWVVGRIILSGNSGEDQFSLYSIGLQWCSLILFIPGMVSRVILPRLIREEAQKDRIGKPTLTTQAALVATMAAIFTALVGSIFSPFILDFYGNDYKLSAWFLIVFMVAAIPASPANTLGNAIIARNGQLKWLVLIALWFICLVLMSFLFIEYGALSGAFSYAISYFMLTLMAVASARKMRLI